MKFSVASVAAVASILAQSAISCLVVEGKYYAIQSLDVTVKDNGNLMCWSHDGWNTINGRKNLHCLSGYAAWIDDANSNNQAMCYSYHNQNYCVDGMRSITEERNGNKLTFLVQWFQVQKGDHLWYTNLKAKNYGC